MESSIDEILAYGVSYVDTKIDGMKLSVQKNISDIVLGACTVFFGIMMRIIAVAFLMYGIAMGLGVALGGKIWLGYMITGGSFILGKIVVSKFVHVHARKKSLEKRLKQYDLERKNWNEKFGHPLHPSYAGSIGPFKDESDFLNWKADVARLAIIKTSQGLKEEISETINVKKWTQEYPFYSTGVAGVAGFIMAGQMSASKPVCDTSPPQTTVTPTLGQSFISMLLTVTEDILKEVVKPIIAAHATIVPREKSEE